VNLKWKFIYLGRRPSPSPLLSPDVLADVDVVDLKLSINPSPSNLRFVHLGSKQGSYKTWKSLNVVEFVKKYLKFAFKLILHVHIWQSCLKLIEVAFWTIQCHFLLISNGLKPFCTPWISWYMSLNALEKSLNSTLPDLRTLVKMLKVWIIPW
jgi:hypothetical protein